MLNHSMTLSTDRLNMLRVGGEFELAWDRDSSSAATRPFEHFEYSSLWLDTGRSALLLIAKYILSNGGNKRVWLPAYGCVSITQAFNQAGYAIQYYEIADFLQTGRLSIPELVVGDSIVFIQYFGFEIAGFAEISSKLKAEGVWVVEDWVQSSLNLNPNLNGDFAVTSYRKFLSVPDGAVIYSKSPLKLSALGVPLYDANESFVSSKLLAKIMRTHSSQQTDFLTLLHEAESILESTITPRKVSFISNWLLAHTDFSTLAKKRQSNFKVLTDALSHLESNHCIRLIYRNLSPQIVPLGLPILVGRNLRDKLRAFLADKQIYCPIHWNLDYLPDNQFPNERALAASMITVPIDQRMSADHIEWVAQAFNQFFRE